MTGRGLIFGAVILSVFVDVPLLTAQNPGRSRSLVDRLTSLRKGWASGDSEATERVRQTAEPYRASSTGSRYPRVDARQLLPPDYSGAVRGSTAEPNSPSSHTPRAQMASRPRISSNAQAPTPDQPSRPGPVLGSGERGEAGPNFIEARSPRTATPILPIVPGNAADSSTGSMFEASVPARGAQPPVASRPSPKIRRSPSSKPKYDFDPEELKRDLVDTTGQTVIERQMKESELESEESQSTLEVEATDGIQVPVPMVLGSPDAMPIDAVQPLEEAESSGVLEGQSLDFQQATDNSGPVETPLPPSPNASDQQRVRLDGEKAFTQESQELAASSSDNSLPAGSAAADESNSSPVHSIGSAHGQDTFLTDSRASMSNEHVLVSNRMPVISSQVSGSRKILIGREATYKLRLLNESHVAANEVVARVSVPAWADVVDTSATNGIIQRAQNPHEPNTFRWQLHTLPSQGSEILELRLIPRSSRPLELGLEWSYAPAGSRAVIEVQEPKLRMHVTGPEEVLYGKPQLYRLTLTNPGTGTAEEVHIDLLPPGGGEQTVSSHFVGELTPGTSKSVEVELTAREPGKLFVKASASASGGISAETSKEIFCRKPELEVDWRGPEQKYAGTVATYFFRVRNPGTAAADDVEVAVKLPAGVEFLRASDGQVLDPSRETVKWRIPALRPGDDYYMELRCLVNTAGVNNFEITAATAAGDLTDRLTAATHVVALADLKLDVTDPSGPIPVGEETIYEIRVRNRGSNTAEDVNIIALFSDGIDAESAEGAQSSIADGRVTFRTIEKLPAGRDVVLRIRARAKLAGTHVFRAEVLCRDLEIKLAAEETTRFFQDEVLGNPDGMLPNSASNGSLFEDSTGNRY